MQPLRRAFEAVYHGDTRARLAEQVAMHLRAQLPADHIVLPRYAARDGGERVSLVVVGRERIFVIEPRDEDGELVCYQDHWYRKFGATIGQPLADAPSLRARRDAGRVRSDLGTGGFMGVPIEPLVLLVRGRPDDVRSSSVTVVAGVDALARHLLQGEPALAAPERTLALAMALQHRITVTTT